MDYVFNWREPLEYPNGAFNKPWAKKERHKYMSRKHRGISDLVITGYSSPDVDVGTAQFWVNTYNTNVDGILIAQYELYTLSDCEEFCPDGPDAVEYHIDGNEKPLQKILRALRPDIVSVSGGADGYIPFFQPFVGPGGQVTINGNMVTDGPNAFKDFSLTISPEVGVGQAGVSPEGSLILYYYTGEREDISTDLLKTNTFTRGEIPTWNVSLGFMRLVISNLQDENGAHQMLFGIGVGQNDASLGVGNTFELLNND